MKEAGRDVELPIVRRPIASEKACPGLGYYLKEIETCEQKFQKRTELPTEPLCKASYLTGSSAMAVDMLHLPRA